MRGRLEAQGGQKNSLTATRAICSLQEAKLEKGTMRMRGGAPRAFHKLPVSCKTRPHPRPAAHHHPSFGGRGLCSAFDVGVQIQGQKPSRQRPRRGEKTALGDGGGVSGGPLPPPTPAPLSWIEFWVSIPSLAPKSTLPAPQTPPVPLRLSPTRNSLKKTVFYAKKISLKSQFLVPLSVLIFLSKGKHGIPGNNQIRKSLLSVPSSLSAQEQKRSWKGREAGGIVQAQQSQRFGVRSANRPGLARQGSWAGPAQSRPRLLADRHCEPIC